MMRQYDLIERVKRYNPATSEALLNRAYVYTDDHHRSAVEERLRALIDARDEVIW